MRIKRVLICCLETHCGRREKGSDQRSESGRPVVRPRSELRGVQQNDGRGIERFVCDKLRGATIEDFARQVRRGQLYADHNARHDRLSARA